MMMKMKTFINCFMIVTSISCKANLPQEKYTYEIVEVTSYCPKEQRQCKDHPIEADNNTKIFKYKR